MKWIACLVIAIATAVGVLTDMAPASGQTDGAAAPIFGVKIPPGYRDWSLISLAHVGGNLNDLRVKLGNDVAIKAYREGKPFPDGTIIARLAYRQVSSEEDNTLLRGILERSGLSPEQVTKLLAESFVAGPATNVQFMVKDSRKYPAAGGSRNSPTANRTARRCTRPAFPVTSRARIATSSSPVTHPDADGRTDWDITSGAASDLGEGREDEF